MARKTKAAEQGEKDDYLRDLKRKFMRAQDICEPARREWETDQDYYDGKQWSQAEKAILSRRKQPALVFEEVKPAVNGIIGLVERGKVDPKAWGRTPKDSDAAEVATDSLRYVTDVARFQSTRSQGLKDYFIPGIVCAVVEIDDDREIQIRKGRPEEFFYDPYSREPNFSDARYLGLAKWMDESDVIARYPEHEDAIKAAVESNGLFVNDTHEDRPKGWAWADVKSRRLMTVEMYHRNGMEWRKCVFIAGAVLEQGPSPYRDDKGRPFCNLIAQSAYVDRENQRYGVVRSMRGPQDATNKGWSKVIHILNVSKLRVSRKVGDIDEVRAEYAKPDGIIQGEVGEVEELGDKQLVPAHVEMLQFADAKMRRVSPTPGIVGRQSGGQSGRALLAEQQAGMTEMAMLFGQFDDWTLRIYRACWYLVKQFWDAPKFIRVTDDEAAPKYILLNGPSQDPQTGEVTMHVPAMMDMDIVIDSSPDTAVIQQEQFDKLVELAQIATQAGQPMPFPFEAIIEASSLPRKKAVLDKMKSPPQPSQAQLEQEQLAKEAATAKIAVDKTKAMKTMAETDQIEQSLGQAQAEPAMQMQAHQNELATAQDQHAQQMQQMNEAHQMKMGQMDQAHRAKMAQALQAMRLKEQAQRSAQGSADQA